MSHLNTTRTVRIATRKSALALWQAEYVKAKLIVGALSVNDR